MSGIKIPIQAAFDRGNVDQVLQDFQRQLNKLGQQVAQANKVKFNPIEKTTVDDLKRVIASFESLRKISGDLNKRMRSTGQAGAGFLDLDWDRMYPDAHSRARQMHKAFSYVVGPQFSGSPAQPGGGGAGGGSGGGHGHWGSAGMGVVNAGLRATGPVGGVASNAISAGISGGMGAGLAGLVGGIAALALGKAIGSVLEKVGQAQQREIGYDTLKRTLGDVNVSFNVLKESLRGSARMLDMTFEESQKLGVQFAKLSGMTADQYKTLAEEVNVSGGFGRSFGVDPSQSNQFFAQMRTNRVTTNSRESRELALLIGESVAKSGTTAKMEEVLESIAGFTAQQSRMGLTAPNVGGYAEMMTGLMASKRAGLDPAGAAALLGRVNSAIAGGGAAGEAGQNFLYSAIGGRLGLNPIQAKLLQEQGAFGTGRAAFGEGSLYAQYSGRRIGAGGSNITNLEMVMDHIRKTSNGNTDLDADRLANLFGINITQAMAMSSISPKLLGGLSSRIKGLGININDVNATGINRISQIEADGSLSEEEKNKRIKEAATQNQEKTQGSEIRAGLAGVERATEKMAEKLLEPLNVMRHGIMYMAGEGKKSSRQVMESMMSIESEDRISMINDDFSKSRGAAGDKYLAALNARNRYQRNSHGGPMGGLTPGLDPKEYQTQMKILLAAEKAAKEEKEKADLGEQYVKAIKAEKEKLAKSIEQIRNGNTLADAAEAAGTPAPGAPGGSGMGTLSSGASPYDDLFTKYEKMYGLPAGVLKATALKENRRMNPGAVGSMNANGTQDYGLMQHNSRYLAERGLTDSWSNPERSVEEAAKLWSKNLKASGGDLRGASRRYNGSGPAAESYADDWMNIYGSASAGTPLPAGASASGGGAGGQDVRVTGEVVVKNQDGKTVGVAALQPTGRVGRPNPQAVR